MSIKKIILTHHTHTDIGYTANPHEVAVQHIRSMRNILRLCRQDSRFRWTVETSWVIQQFLQAASKSEVNEFFKFVHNGQIEITAFFTQPLSQLCNLEELCATCEITQSMLNAHDIPVETAMLNDIGGISYNFPQIANYYGIRYFVNGCGGWRVMLPYTTLPKLFYLSGPDDSKILYYHIGDDIGDRLKGARPAQYGFGVIYFLWPMLRHIDGRQNLAGNDGEKTILNMHGREGIDYLCRRLEGESYPYDTLLLQVSTDNCGPFERLLEAVDAWNSKYKSPGITLGTCRHFFTDIERRYKNCIPVVKGELTCSWSEHAITNARATGDYRNARRLLFDWAALNTSAGIACDFNQWRQIMNELVMFSDHTCGLSMWLWQDLVAEYGSLWDETFDIPRYLWQSKAAHAQQALSEIHKAMERQFVTLCSADTDTPDSISVFNPNSFRTNSIVKFVTDQPSIELEDDDGRTLPVDSRKINLKRFLHKTWIDALPPLSAKNCTIRESLKPPNIRFVAGSWSLSGPTMRVKIDPRNGGISSVRTLGQKKEWVSAKTGCLNELLYCMVDGVSPQNTQGGLEEKVTFNRLTLTRVEQKGAVSGANSASILIERIIDQHSNPVSIETQYILDAGGISIRNRIRKIHTTEREACFFAFPFRMKKPFAFDIEQQGQITRFPAERLPGASNHNLAAQDFVSLSDASSQVILTSFQTCLVALGRPSYYHFGLDYPQIKRPVILSYAFNNLWNTNCPLHQDGDLVFNYHITFLSRKFSPVKAYQASRTVSHPPIAIPGRLSLNSVLTLSTDSVLVESIRPEKTNMLLVRLVGITSKPVTCFARFDNRCFSQYCVCTRHGTAHTWKKIPKRPVKLKFRPAQFKTILLRHRHDTLRLC